VNAEGPAPAAHFSVMGFLKNHLADVALQRRTWTVASSAVEQMDGIDISATNAGLAYWERIWEPDCGRIEAIIQTNVFSPV
jgi:NADP-dependent 3-hydroxy acid dehydrogenase YdfG